MGKVYVEQDKLVLYIHTGTDLTEASGVQIYRTKPNGDSGSILTATIEDIDKGIVSYEVNDADFENAGTWIVWVKVLYQGGPIAYGEPFHFNVYETGT